MGQLCLQTVLLLRYRSRGVGDHFLSPFPFFVDCLLWLILCPHKRTLPSKLTGLELNRARYAAAAVTLAQR